VFTAEVGRYVYGTLDRERVFHKIPQETTQYTKKFVVYLCLKFFHLDILRKILLNPS
jgi:hypothetical protein